MPEFSSRSSAAAAAGAAGSVTPAAGVPAVSVAAASAPSHQCTAADESRAASVSGGVGRAAGVIGANASRILGPLFRVPIKTFRQNKFDLAEGHQPLASVQAAGSAKPVQPLQLLMATQGRSAVLVKQILPSLAANVAVGSLMFAAFDRTMAGLSNAADQGTIPRWVCSTTLSTGLPTTPTPSGESDSHSLRHRLSTAFLRPRTGIDVFLAGGVAGAASSIVTTGMENSASVMRIRYQALAKAAMEQSATSASAGVSPAPRLSASVGALESTLVSLMPPTAPRHLATLNLAAVVREMATSTPAAGSGLPSLFTHFTFRLARDAIGMGAFFFTFEALHAQMRVVPYRWMEVNEHAPSPAPSPQAGPSGPLVSGLPLVSPPGPPSSLLGSLLAWEVVSVVASGVSAGAVFHTVSFPFFQTLQRLETRTLHSVVGHPMTSAPRTAWSELLHLARTRGVRGLFHGLLGEPGSASGGSSSGRALRPKLLNPMVLGLVFYTLTKSEQHTHQWTAWRDERHKQRHRLYRM